MIPEPKTFNGGPGEAGGYVGRGTGRRREPSLTESRPGATRCAACGSVVVTVFSLANVGIFCSDECRERGPRELTNFADTLQRAVEASKGARK